MGKFEIRRTSGGQLYFVLKARNGEIVATGETYKTRSGCKRAIASMKKAARTNKVEEDK